MLVLMLFVGARRGVCVGVLHQEEEEEGEGEEERCETCPSSPFSASSGGELHDGRWSMGGW